MTSTHVLEQAYAFVRRELGAETTGHDYWHSCRVARNAVLIGREEGVDLFVVELAAVLHDIGDWKLHGGDESVAERKIRGFLASVSVEAVVQDHIIAIVNSMTFKGAKNLTSLPTREGLVVQDADRLDALGAIGIARTFASGQKFGNVLHDPLMPSIIDKTENEYRKQYTGEKPTTSINHFSEKLLLLKDLMNTSAARRIAEHRHTFMESYLEEFHAEWNGER